MADFKYAESFLHLYCHTVQCLQQFTMGGKSMRFLVNRLLWHLLKCLTATTVKYNMYLYFVNMKDAAKPIALSYISLHTDFTKHSSESNTRWTSDVHCNMVAQTETVASVPASSQPIWRDQVAGNAPWMIAHTIPAITDDVDTQAKRWAAFQISHKRHVELALNSDIRKWNLHPLSRVRVQCETGCQIRIQNFRNLGVIFVDHGCYRYRTDWFQEKERHGFWKKIYLGLV